MKFYFCGSMTFDRSKINDYKQMINKLKEYGTVLNEFVGEDIIDDKAPLDEYNQDVNNLDVADMLIADITVPSTGVGFEIGYYEKLNRPMLFLYEKNKPLPSSLIRGIPKASIKAYDDLAEALTIIEEFVKNAK